MKRALCIFVTTLQLVVAASQAVAYSDKELADAQEFIFTKLTPEKKTLLQDLAEKAGKSPAEMFLDMSKLSGDASLDEGSPGAVGGVSAGGRAPAP